MPLSSLYGGDATHARTHGLQVSHCEYRILLQNGHHDDGTMQDPVLLQTFLAIAQTRSFARTAERLGLRQSTVSQDIRKLEDEPALRPRYPFGNNDG